MVYPSELKEHVQRILAEPDHPSQSKIARQFGISSTTVHRWACELTGSTSSPSPSSEHTMTTSRTLKDKVRLVHALETLPPEDLGALLRQEGLHLHDVQAWRELFEHAHHAASPQEMQALKRELYEAQHQHKSTLKELQRKEKALAEAAALLILSKKVGQLWGEEDAPTPGQNVNVSSHLFKKP